MINLLDFDIDDITIPIDPEMSGDEIKKANETRSECIICGTPTKQLFNTNYCPNNCDENQKEWDEFGFQIIKEKK